MDTTPMNRPAYILNSLGTWAASNAEIKVRLGLKPDQKLPEHGVRGHLLDGFWVWVEPIGDKYPNNRRRMKHRVRARCHCGAIVSAGRLKQHSKIHEPKTMFGMPVYHVIPGVGITTDLNSQDIAHDAPKLRPRICHECHNERGISIPARPCPHESQP